MSENKIALVKKDTVDIVAKKVREFQERGELHIPPNYSPENAMKSAWLILQETKDKNGKPALEVCTKDSIANSLLDMIVQGLNPAKKQCYFIVYGNKLICQRSYFGSMAVVKNVAGAKDVWAEVVYKGDEFEYEIRKGKKYIRKHVQKLENIDIKNIVAAYAVIEFGDERPDYVEIMTINQIKQAWKQGQIYKENGYGTHQKFTEEMCKKTVINRACKAYINSSNDSNLLLRHFNRTEETLAEEEVNKEIAENANSEVIDIESEPIDEPEPEEEQTEDSEPKQSKENELKKMQQQNMFEKTGTEGPGF